MTEIVQKGAVPFVAPWINDLQESVNFTCIHCGYCLPVCPSYKDNMQEAHSPRGRVALLNELFEHNLEFEEITDSFNTCLGCRACEVVCPKGLDMGGILRAMHRAMPKEKQPKGKQLVFERLMIITVRYRFAHALAHFGAWIYGISRLPRLIAKFDNKLPNNIALGNAMVPELAGPFRQTLRSRKPNGHVKARIALFTGCFQDAFFRETHASTINLLVASGYEVIIPESQTCCGKPAEHIGDSKNELSMAKVNIMAFESSGADLIVTNAGTCGATLKEYHIILRGEEEWSERARRFSEHVRDVYELLEDNNFTPRGRLAGEALVTYIDSCHLMNVQKVIDQPRSLIRRIPAVKYVELDGQSYCCGFAGSYWATQPKTSMNLTELKIKAIKSSGANIVATSHFGCFMQIQAARRKYGLADSVRVIQLVDLLWEAETGG